MELMYICRSLRGSMAQIVLAFLLARQALDVASLRQWTGLGRDTVYEALDNLAALGLVTKQTGRHGRVVWLPAGDLLLGQVSENPTPVLSSSSFLIKESEENKEQRTVQMSENPTSAEALTALLAAGVREPKASALAALPHVTAELVNDHVEWAKEQGHSLGTAIHRIENNWAVESRRKKDDDDRNKYIRGKWADIIQH